MNPLDRILQRAAEQTRREGTRIVLPEGNDPRVREAAAILRKRRIVNPLVLPTDLWRGPMLQVFEQARLGKSSTPELLASWLDEPLFQAAAMVRAGEAQGALAGACHSTSDTLRAALKILGPAEGVSTVSSFFLMALPQPTAAGDRLLAFADCGLVPTPDAAQLAEIAMATAASFRRLTGEEPRVALLSFSTHGSADDPSVRRVREAHDRLQQLQPDFVFDGELQLDAALVPEIAAMKAASGALGGRANVLVFPDLNAGNIGYKLVERLGGAQAVGPLVQGLRAPYNDLSRGASVDDIVVAAAVTALQGS